MSAAINTSARGKREGKKVQPGLSPRPRYFESVVGTVRGHGEEVHPEVDVSRRPNYVARDTRDRHAPRARRVRYLIVRFIVEPPLTSVHTPDPFSSRGYFSTPSRRRKGRATRGRKLRKLPPSPGGDLESWTLINIERDVARERARARARALRFSPRRLYRLP